MDTQVAEGILAATLARLGLAETGLGSVSKTISRRPSGVGPSEPLPAMALDAVSRSGPTGGATSDADLVVRGELGRGGMGVVHLAEQRSLGRDVAVKRALTRDAVVASALVREGRIMGSLEHPNLVPVHALGIDREGAPALVMKRVEGVSWRALLAEPAHPGWRSLLIGHEDRLRANVEVLSQVCRALAFAHDKGVVHRDLKPDNVMIGAFGEVYLLDWGVALRLSEAAGEPPAIVGTPAYLAPEMARGDAALIDARTDVYLLGATLYELLAGRLPREAATPLAALVSALLGEQPPLPSDTPDELAALVRHAMATDPVDRLQSADAFLGGLKRFLASRETDILVAEARGAVARAKTAIMADGPAANDAFRALIEARFGFIAARRIRPRDEALRTELDDCTARLIERELTLRSPGGARTLLAELEMPRPELEARLAELARDVEAERAAAELLRAARQNADASGALSVMQRTLNVMAAVLSPSVAWIAWSQWADGREVPPWQGLSLVLAGFLATVAALVAGRRTAFANEATRRISAMLVVGWVTVLFCNSVSYALGGTNTEAGIATAAAHSCGLAGAAVTFIPDIWPASAFLACVTLFALVFPAAFAKLQLFGLPVYLFLWARAIRLHAARTRVTSTSPAI